LGTEEKLIAFWYSSGVGEDEEEDLDRFALKFLKSVMMSDIQWVL
jgi:hypothetical protein